MNPVYRDYMSECKAFEYNNMLEAHYKFLCFCLKYDSKNEEFLKEFVEYWAKHNVTDCTGIKTSKIKYYKEQHNIELPEYVEDMIGEYEYNLENTLRELLNYKKLLTKYENIFRRIYKVAKENEEPLSEDEDDETPIPFKEILYLLQIEHIDYKKPIVPVEEYI